MSYTEVIKDLKQMVQQMTKESGIEKYTINIDDNIESSTGYMGDIIFFSLTEAPDRKLYLVLKTCKRNKTFRETTCAAEVFTRELCLYSNIFPGLELFLKEKCMNGFLDFVPKACFTCDIPYQESIILENLKYLDFRLCQQRATMNLDHVKLLFETYGKWHGLTMAFKDQYPEKFDEMTKNWVDVKYLVWRKFEIIDCVKEEFSIILDLLRNCGRIDLVNIYEKLEPQIDSLIKSTGQRENILCIIHGDCWVNNLMFRYEQSEKDIPSEVRFLDFQMAMVDSPVIDLSCCLYNVADKNSLSNFDFLLKVYHESLSKTMKSLGSNPERILSMSDLKQHWKRYGFYAVMASSCIMKAQLCDPDEMSTIIGLMGEGVSPAKFVSRNIDKMRERVKDAFIHFGELIKQKKL
ncbi:hypothetical protein HHI36_015193 [Cryptolaemus montrouzieri]|uniref:CHK kinase-like domain-containing protein n=1 Tax=Cryptolaemus montrouzieri TaxID=559131 RepID=A0ABD2N4Y3_9CUCU